MYSSIQRDFQRTFLGSKKVYAIQEDVDLLTLVQSSSNTLFSVYSRTILVLESNSIRLAAVISIGYGSFGED